MKKYIAVLLAVVILLLSAWGVARLILSKQTADTGTNQASTGQNGSKPSDGTGSQDTTNSTTGTTDSTQGTTDSTTTTTPPPTSEPTNPSTNPTTTPTTPTTPPTTPTTTPTGGNSGTGGAGTTTPPTTGSTTPPVVTLTVNRSNLSLMVGESSTLTASYNGTGSLSWSSSNTNVATVVNGKVTAVGAGSATIFVKDGSLSAKCDVSVTAPVVETTLLINTPNNTKLYVNDSLQLDFTYSGDKSKLTWTSYMPDKVTVDSNGKITAKAVGNALINVTDGKITRRINIEVLEHKTEVAPELPKTTSIKTKNFNAPLYDGVVKYAGDYMTFQAATRPIESNSDVTVVSSNSNVVSVSWNKDSSNVNHITLNFNSAGSATITIKSADGAVSKSYSITVKSGYDFNPGSGQLTPEQWADYCTRVMIANGFNKDTTLGSYRVLTLSASELTFSKAQKMGQGLVHEWYINGNRYCWISYEGTNEKGEYIFWTRWG